MNSIILILQCKNIEDILTPENIIKDYEKHFKSNSRVIIKSLSRCVSLHDFSVDFTDIEINDFIEKYKKRHARIIDLITSNKKLCFLRYGNIEETEKKLFIETILNINPNCFFNLVSVNIKRETFTIKQSKNFLEINLTYEPIQKDYEDWTTSYLDWEFIFKTIHDML